jgi:hypothetical protein
MGDLVISVSFFMSTLMAYGDAVRSSSSTCPWSRRLVFLQRE